MDLSLVSLGNEIRHGMLWPYGEVDVDIEPASARVANFSGLGTLYAAARNGVRDAVAHGVKKPQVMIHVRVPALASTNKAPLTCTDRQWLELDASRDLV